MSRRRWIRSRRTTTTFVYHDAVSRISVDSFKCSFSAHVRQVPVRIRIPFSKPENNTFQHHHQAASQMTFAPGPSLHYFISASPLQLKVLDSASAYAMAVCCYLHMSGKWSRFSSMPVHAGRKRGNMQITQRSVVNGLGRPGQSSES